MYWSKLICHSQGSGISAGLLDWISFSWLGLDLLLRVLRVQGVSTVPCQSLHSTRENPPFSLLFCKVKGDGWGLGGRPQGSSWMGYFSGLLDGS